MTYAQPPRPRGHGRPPMRRRHILPALDMEAQALAAGARFGQRIVDLEDGRRRRSVASQYRGIPPRWYQVIGHARRLRDQRLRHIGELLTIYDERGRWQEADELAEVVRGVAMCAEVGVEIDARDLRNALRRYEEARQS